MKRNNIKKLLFLLLDKIFSTRLIYRRFIFLLIDSSLIALAIQTSLFFSSLDENFFSKSEFSWMLRVGIISGILIYACSGQYKAITRFTGRKTIYRIFSRNSVLLILLILIGNFFDLTIKASKELFG